MLVILFVFILVPPQLPSFGLKPWAFNNTSSTLNPSKHLTSPPLTTLLTSSSIYHHQYMLSHQHLSDSSCAINSSIDDCSFHHLPETHKSMWAINPLYSSNSGKHFWIFFWIGQNCFLFQTKTFKLQRFEKMKIVIERDLYLRGEKLSSDRFQQLMPIYTQRFNFHIFV